MLHRTVSHIRSELYVKNVLPVPSVLLWFSKTTFGNQGYSIQVMRSAKALRNKAVKPRMPPTSLQPPPFGSLSLSLSLDLHICIHHKAESETRGETRSISPSIQVFAQAAMRNQC